MTGKTNRLEQLVEPHLDALYRAAYRLCRNTPDAQDLVQEVCLRAFDKADDLETADSPRAWLLRVEYNLYVDTLRRASRASRHTRVEACGPAAEGSADPPTPETHAEAAQLAEQLSCVWPHLNEDQRALLALHAEGYSLAELTDITGLPPSALKARLHRARSRLGKLLRERQERPRAAAISGDRV